ncbi:MAG: hypothetical protein AAGD11_00590 [Planctomycetota bacterium]
MVFFGLIALATMPGCTLCLNAKRTLLDEPARFSWQTDRKRSVQVYRTWADRAWGVECSNNPESSTSPPFEAGFKDGFVDYVYAGGTGEPPPVAPRKYWNVGHRNPHGHAAAAEWFAGYRLGAEIARIEGYRERALAPTQAMLLGPIENEASPQPTYAAPLPDWSQAEPIPVGPAAQPELPGESSAPSLVVPPRDALPANELPSPPLQVEPETQPETADPQINSTPIEVPELPQVELPPADPPAATDILPTEPKTPEAPQPSDDVDDIFGPPTAFQSTSTDAATNDQNGKQPSGRLAFAVAIRNKLQADMSVHEPNSVTKRPAQRLPLDRTRPVDPHASIRHTRLPKVTPASATVSERPGSISQSDDRAEEMFRRLSK